MAKYFESFEPNEYVFPFTRQRVGQFASKVFTGLSYPFEKYTNVRRLLTAEGEEVKVSERRPRHWRPFRPHALRHARATDLKKFYRFDDLEICQWTGWEVGGLSKIMARYMSL